MPCHPAVVHLPVGVGLAVPIVALAALVGLWWQALTRRAWLVVVLLQGLAFGGGLVAMRTGQWEEERVEDVVGEHRIEEHEERAELFLWLSGASLAAGVAVLLLPGAWAGLLAAIAATLLGTAAAGAVAWKGHLGGRLVYIHGAARPYQAVQRHGEAGD